MYLHVDPWLREGEVSTAGEEDVASGDGLSGLLKREDSDRGGGVEAGDAGERDGSDGGAGERSDGDVLTLVAEGGSVEAHEAGPENGGAGALLVRDDVETQLALCVVEFGREDDWCVEALRVVVERLPAAVVVDGGP